jgi:hypothetical protein
MGRLLFNTSRDRDDTLSDSLVPQRIVRMYGVIGFAVFLTSTRDVCWPRVQTTPIDQAVVRGTVTV